jgi:hypothetical protein
MTDELEGPRNTTKSHNKDSRCPSQDSNRRPSEYDSRASALLQQLETGNAKEKDEWKKLEKIATLSAQGRHRQPVNK